MPLTASGKKVLSDMTQQYGSKKGKAVFYASINKGKKGSSQWHRMGKHAGKHRARSLTKGA